MAVTRTTKAPARVIKDSPMRSTLGKKRIRKAIQEVLRESAADKTRSVRVGTPRSETERRAQEYRSANRK